MFLVAWWLTGVLLGWFIWQFYKIWRSERRRQALDASSLDQLNALTKALLALQRVLAALYGYPPAIQPHEEGSTDLVRPSVKTLGRWLAALIVIALLVIAFAAATDNAQLLQCVLVVKSYLVGIRVQAFIVGILSGLVFRQYRRQLGNFGRRLGNAVIGDKDGSTAWALQGALAVGLIAIGLFVVRPDLLLYLKSFKFGTVEATFGDQGPLPLRDARLNLREFREKIAVRQYKKFREDFISASSPRGLARRDLSSPTIVDIQQESGEIASLIFEQYVNPVLSSVLCLARAHALNEAIHDPDLSLYSSAWQDFLLQIHRDDRLLTSSLLKTFLISLPRKSAPFIKRVRDAYPECKEDLPAIEPAYSRTLINTIAADQVALLYKNALDKQQKVNKASVRSLRIFDPYLTGAAADLVALISGEGEKADFLLNILSDFDPSDDDITPGIINLHYQVTDSWLNSIGSLPLDLVRSQIEYAIHGVDVLMARSGSRLDEIEKRASADSQERKTPEQVTEEEKQRKKDAKNMSTIYGIFLRNSFATLTAEVDVYVRHILADEKIPEGHRQSWVKAASRLQAMLQARLNLPVANIDGLFTVELNARMKAHLHEDEGLDLQSDIKIDPDFLLQADLAIALTSILLPDRNRVSVQNCTAALFYVNEASASVQPTIEVNELDKAQEHHLRQLIRTVANRVGDTCSWTDAGSQAKLSEAKTK
ncbi:hypothetical protein IVB29_03390 [Bradyrhizobium sp. 1]|nr:hypothetical protein [Bradyrhizobium sp. 1]